MNYNLVESDESRYPLPVEIIFGEILTRLPVKSLVRFESVGKSWKLVISSDSDFIKSHLRVNKNKNCLMVRSWTCFNMARILNDDTMFVGSVNGLVCFYNWNPPNFNSIRHIGIWNPAIKQLKQISPLSSHTSDEPRQCRKFAFGFGFKVIYLRTVREERLVADVYSCEAECWSKRNIVLPDFVFRGSLITGCTIVKGNPYWLYSEYETESSIIWFDTRHDVLRRMSAAELPVPETLPVGVISIDFGKEEKLVHHTVLVDFMNTVAAMLHGNQQVNFYHYYERGGVWCKTYTVSGINIIRGLRCFWEGDVLFCDSQERLCCINPETRQVRILRNITRINHAFPHRESLIYLKGMKPLHISESLSGVRFITKYFS